MGNGGRQSGRQLGIYDSRYVERYIPNKPYKGFCTLAVVFVELSGDELL